MSSSSESESSPRSSGASPDSDAESSYSSEEMGESESSSPSGSAERKQDEAKADEAAPAKEEKPEKSSDAGKGEEGPQESKGEEEKPAKSKDGEEKKEQPVKSKGEEEKEEPAKSTGEKEKEKKEKPAKSKGEEEKPAKSKDEEEKKEKPAKSKGEEEKPAKSKDGEEKKEKPAKSKGEKKHHGKKKEKSPESAQEKTEREEKPQSTAGEAPTPSVSETDNVKYDRYGWKLPDEHVAEDKKLVAKESKKETEREVKWSEMLAHWAEYRKHRNDKIESRVMKGIPESIRPRAWQLLIDPECDKMQAEGKRAAVADMVAYGRDKCCDTIEVDLHRTMPKMRNFNDQKVIDSLRNVLQAYSNVDKELGYIQGMGFLAAMFLSYMDETSAYWCFANLMNGPVFKMRWLYIDQFAGLQELCTIWELLLKERYPKVLKALTKNNVVPQIYATSWFLTAYMNSDFPTPLRLRIFDRFVTFGCRALLSFGLAIISLTKRELVKGDLSVCIRTMQKPEELPVFRDWRHVMEKYDKLFLTRKEYKALFKKADITLFY